MKDHYEKVLVAAAMIKDLARREDILKANHFIDLLAEMKENCVSGKNYDDPKRLDKIEALNFAIATCVEKISKY